MQDFSIVIEWVYIIENFKYVWKIKLTFIMNE